MTAVRCPRCQGRLVAGKCPECEPEFKSPTQSSSDSDSLRSRQLPIDFSFSTEPPAETAKTLSSSSDQITTSWRQELKKKLEQHAGKNKRETAPEKSSSKPAPEVQPDRPLKSRPPSALGGENKLSEGKASPILFQYSLAAPAAMERTKKQIVETPVLKKQANAGEDAGERSSSRPRPATKPVSPLQKRLHLQSAVPRPAEELVSSQEVEPAPIEVSAEILFSRTLSGIVDLTIPLVTGLLFAFLAALILEYDFFTVDSLQIGGLFALFFFFLNSLFFLLTSGQTPGMLLTDLRLVADDTEADKMSAGSLLLRVALFLPVALTLVGLIWAFFDPLRRCWHDRLSGTRVVPLHR